MEMLDTMLEQKTISAEDLELVMLTDDIDEAVAHIRKYIETNYKIKKRQRPSWWLFEKI
jgi:predicted Rossmann-fold nucleotide-binding protein